MTEEISIDEHFDEIPENPAKKQPIPRYVSGVAYITKSGTVRYCRTGIDISLPPDFKEWHCRINLTNSDALADAL